MSTKPRLVWSDYFGQRVPEEYAEMQREAIANRAEIDRMQAKHITKGLSREQLAEQVVAAAKVFLAARLRPLEQRIKNLEARNGDGTGT